MNDEVLAHVPTDEDGVVTIRVGQRIEAYAKVETVGGAWVEFRNRIEVLGVEGNEVTLHVQNTREGAGFE